MSVPEPSQPRLSASLKGLSVTVLELLRVRLELLSVEAQEELLRVGGLLVFAALAVSLLSLGLCFLAVFITVALWDSHRLLPLAVFSTLFLVLGAVAAWLARERALRGSALFAASVAELRRDAQELRS